MRKAIREIIRETIYNHPEFGNVDAGSGEEEEENEAYKDHKEKLYGKLKDHPDPAVRELGASDDKENRRMGAFLADDGKNPEYQEPDYKEYEKEDFLELSDAKLTPDIDRKKGVSSDIEDWFYRNKFDEEIESKARNILSGQDIMEKVGQDKTFEKKFDRLINKTLEEDVNNSGYYSMPEPYYGDFLMKRAKLHVETFTWSVLQRILFKELLKDKKVKNLHKFIERKWSESRKGESQIIPGCIQEVIGTYIGNDSDAQSWIEYYAQIAVLKSDF